MKTSTPTVLLLVHVGWLLCGLSTAWLVQEPPGGVDPLPNRLEGKVEPSEGVDPLLNRKKGVVVLSKGVHPQSRRTETEEVIEASGVNETQTTLLSLTSVYDFGEDLFDVDNKVSLERSNSIFENVKRRRRKREVQAAPVTYRRREEEEGIYISYNELGEVDRFSSGSVKSYRNLLFDPANYQLIVGARDHLYRLSLTGFHVLESASWAPDLDTVRMCEIKGQDSYHCHNFVTLLEKHDGRLLACGTNAFRPLCSWRSLTSISTMEELFKGVSQSPFDPDLTSTHLMAGDGSLFVGTTNDFHGRDPAFMRLEGPQSWLRTAQNDYKWLSQPSFVSSFETGGFVYFFFRENAVEYLNCGERVYPRIGRICKDDPGGSGGHAEKWTTFLKARLDCSVPGGSSAFHYDSLQSITFLPAEDVFYGLFTTQDNGVAGSALCSFNMTSVNKSFDGPFKYQSGPSAAWTPVYDNLDHYKCQYGDIGSDPSMLSKASVNANKYQLMDTDVQPVHPDPVYTIDHERLTHIAVDVVPTRQSGPVHVLYVAGEDATIRKISVVPGSSRTAVSNRNTSTTCLLEVIAPFPRNATAKIHTLKFLRETHSLYIGTETEVVRVPVHRCQRYGSRSACLAAQDPYCGWDRDLLECSPPPDQNPFDSSWVQEVIDCPTNTEPIDGRWSPWSPWESCLQSDSSDGCQCRHRTCDAPAPTRGGEYCEGHTTEVSNCTVHGGWTAWSAWSQCSATCGVAVKTRRRSCTNPAPQHGGRVCVGLDHNEIYCHLLPPCPVSTHLPVPGGWGSWSKWSNCSAQCGEGVQRRTRLCNNPRPKHGGALCPGCDEQTEQCQGTRCASVQEYSSWTPWLVSTDLEIDGLQKRYRVQCSATAGIHPELSVDMSHEERFCPDGESCTTTAVLRSGGLWEEWNEWSACDRECGTGQQSRWRACASSDCDGRSTQHRACNTHPCKGDWSCWSDWGACTPSCGDGVQQRTRVCLASRSPRLEASDCAGVRVDERPCQGPNCYIPPGEEGWSPWSVWASCVSKEQFRARTRVCASQDPSRCRGLDQQKEACLEVMEPPDVTLLESRRPEPSSHAQISVGSLAGACLACLLLGIIVGALCLHAYHVRQRHRQVPSSPHYLSVKPNQYVTVPGAQWKITTKAERDKNVPKGQQLPMTPTATLKHSLKRQGSVRDPYTTLPLKDIDTATIKRSSHSSYSNGHLRADLDSDTIFNF